MNAKPRLAYAINSLEGGGAALPVPAILGVLRGAGVQVRVLALTRRDGRALPAMEAAGLDIVIRDGGETDHLAAARWLGRELRGWGATHLWTSLSRATILGLMVGPRLGIPVVCWQHNAFLKPWNERLLRLLQTRAALWVADSRVVAGLTAERLGVSADRLATWPIYAADPAMPQAGPWQQGEMLRLGSLGRLHPAKGYDVLIAALARLRADGFRPPVPFEIAIAGDGGEGERLAALAGTAGIGELRFAGYSPAPRAFLAGLHLYLQPSRREGFCIAGHEALTAGLPVVASRVGELAFSVRPQVNGWLAVPGDPQSLAAALREALADPGALAAFGLRGRTQMLEDYSQAHFERTGKAIWAGLAGSG
ncbi:glycosyltransferase [Novosphingobium sp. P6W]|uniref:glycosyltransferase n=1 Tax=Novosphingobium sp. P6W TaxID=1609758 RepID=UPI0005C31C8F|nr:glycosyltransferase [Novosphingobium sp. P6W]AXB76561.1 glycosyltransferase [Novosphingobium sp. P6W]KIS30806.1 glycosyl transferase family 1 [Novosphingobium sp. P6W]